MFSKVSNAFFRKYLIFLFLFVGFISIAQPPACTTTFANGNGVFVVNAGETACIPSGSSFTGSLVVRAGGHVVVCNGTFTGSLTIDPAFGATPAGKLWTIGTQNFTGAVANNGTTSTAAGNCGAVVCPDTSLNNSPAVVCSSGGTIDLSALLTAGTAAGTWSIPAAGRPGGAGDLATLSGVNNATFNINNTVGGTYTVRHTLTAPGANPCGQFAERTVTIQRPTVTFTIPDDTMCISEGAIALSGGSPAVVAPATGLYSGAGVTLGTTFTPSTLGVGNSTITYTYTDADGCPNTATDILYVLDTPTVTFVIPDDTMCISEPALALTGGLPAAVAPATGVYSGAGVTLGTTFTPSTLGVGNSTITYTYTDALGCSNARTDILYVLDTPTVTFVIPDDTMCISEPALALTGGLPAAVLPATGVYTGVGVTGGTTFTPSTLGVGNSTITYTYTDALGCSNARTDIMYVLDTPTVTFVIPDDTMCISEPALALTGGLPAAVLPATGVYTGVGVTLGTTFTPSTLGVGNSTITYTYTDALGCSNARTDIMYVLDTPTVTFVIPDDTMCISEPALALTGGLPAAVLPATGVYSGAGVTLGTTFTPSTLGVGNSTITYTYTDALGCSNARTDIMYVLDTPTVTFVIPDDTMCISEPALALTGGLPAAVLPATGVYSGAGVTLGTTFTPSTLGVGNSTITYTYTDALGCSNARTDIMYVLDTPTVTFVIPDDTMCISEPALALTGGLPAAVLPATGVYSGAGVTLGTTFTPSTLGVGNSTITYTYTDALGCSNARTDIMYVLDTPTVTFVIPDDTMCISEPALALTGGLPAAVLPATGVYTGVGVTGGTTFTPSTLGVGNSTITYTYTDALGCSNARTDIMYVLDTPTVTFVIPDDTMCISEPALALTGGLPAAVAPATGVYSGAGVTLGTTFTPSTLGVGNSTITYTYTDALGCSNARTDIMYVLDTPTVTFVIPDDTMCISEPALALTGGLPAAVAPATGVYSGAGVTLGTTFTPSTLGVGNSTITYTYTDALGCSNARTDIMYVLDTPTVTFVIPDDTMCISEPALALTGGLPAAVLPATGVYTGAGVTGGTTFTPSTLGVGNSTITYTYTDALGCSNARTDIMYVLDTPTVTFVIPDDTMCISEPALALIGGLPAAVAPATGVYSGAGVTLGTTFTPSTLGVGNSTITYTYTDALGCSNARTDIMYVLDTPTVTFVIPDDTMCISEPALALTGGLPAAVLPATGVYTGVGVTLGTTFTPSTLGVGNSTITYTYTDALGCSNARTDIMYVLDTPTVTFVIPDDTMCISEPALALTGGLPAAVLPATGVYTGVGVTLGTTFTPSTLGVGNSTITYTYTDALGCSNARTDIMYVLDTPTVTFVIPDDTMCISEPALALTGGLPAAVLPATGVYSGAGVTLGTTFTPSTLGVGNSTITYTYTDALGCSNARTDIMYVLDTPTVTFVIPDDTMCISEPALALTGGLPAAVLPATGVYTGVGVTLGTTFTPSTLGVGNSTITYTYKDALGCSNARTDIMYVLDTPTVTFVIPDDTMCISEPALALTGGLPAAVLPATGVYTGVGVTLGTTFTPSTLGVGNSTITYTYTDALGCSNARTDIMYVLDTPTVTFVIPDDTMCISEPALALTGGLPAAVLPATGVYTGVGVTLGTTFTPSTLGVGNSTITYTYTDALGCSNARTDIMYVLDTPTVTFVIPDDTMCISEPALALTGGLPAAVLPATGVYSGAGVTLGTTFTPSTLGVGNSTITYTYTDALGCSNARTDIMYVLDTPTVTFVIPDDTMCISEPALALTGGLPAAVLPATGVYTGVGVTLGTTFTPSTLGVGNSTITYTYKDALGCSNARTDIMYVLDTPTVTFVIPDDTMCISEPALALTGGLPAAVLPATGVYTGVGVTLGTTFTPSTLGVGNSTITYTYTDALGCSNARTDIMYVLDTPTVTFVIPDDTMCISEPALALTGGLPAAVLPATGVYSGAGVTLGTTFTPSTLGVGNSTITYTYTDASGCSNTATDIMYVLGLPVVSLTLGTDEACEDAGALALTGGSPAAVLPATGVYSGTGISTSPSFSPSVATAGPHTITYTYTDIYGCVNTATDVFTVNALPVVSFASLSEKCIDAAPFVINSGSPSGGEYSGTGVEKQGDFYPKNSWVGQHNLRYTYIDGNGCEDYAEQMQVMNPLPSVDMGIDLVICENVPQVISIPSYDKIVWGNGTVGPTSFTVDTAMEVTVEVWNQFGCKDTDTLTTSFVPKLEVENLRADTVICERASDQVLLSITNTNVNVEWQNGAMGSQYTATNSGEYIVFISDVNGCTANDTVYLKDSCSTIGLTMPNVFTPNFTNYNDYFIPVEMEWADKDFIMSNIQYIQFQVFDRWGIMVHASQGALPRWDGRAPNGYPCSDGTYFWKLEFSDVAGNENNRSGFVKLYRPE